MQPSKQAEELNQIIKSNNPVLFEFLSERGKCAYMPKEGILAQSAQAKGKRINATIGIAIEDDGSPMRLNCIAEKILLDPKDVFPYSSSQGKPELREEWKKDMLKKNPSLKAQISTPIITNALTHGLSVLGMLFLNPEDRIITPDLFWGNYKLIFENSLGAKIETFNTFKGNDFDILAMEEKLKGEGKKILLLNFPNNPSGYSPTKEEAKQIVELIKKYAEEGTKILVILDEAYFGLFYEDSTEKESLFSWLADIHPNVIAIKGDAATKEDYVWGLRVGFLTFGWKNATLEAYKAIEDKIAGTIRGNISMGPHISQSLVLSALRAPSYEQEKKEKFELLKQRYKKVKEVLANDKYKETFEVLPFNSGYFMCIKPKANAEKVRLKLLEKYETGVICQKDLLRISFSCVPKNTIEELFDNIYNACKESV